MRQLCSIIIILFLSFSIKTHAQSKIEEFTVVIMIEDFIDIKDTIIPAKDFRKFEGLVIGTKNDSLSFDGWENTKVLSYNMIRYHNGTRTEARVPKTGFIPNEATKLAPWTYTKNIIVFEDVVFQRRYGLSMANLDDCTTDTLVLPKHTVYLK